MKIMVIGNIDPYRFFYTEETIQNINSKCIMCDHGIPFTTDAESSMILPIDDYADTSDYIVTHHENDLMNDQERFLKERDKKFFNKIRKGR